MVRACQKPCFVTMGRRPRRGRLPIVPSGVPVVSRVRFVLPPSSASHAVGNGIPARRGDGRDGGGWGIRTPEGLHPTRFPSVRHRPLGESSRRSTRRQPRATRKEYIGPSIPGASPGRWDLSRKAGRDGSQPGAGSGSLSLGPSCGVIQRIPQDRKVARVSRLWRVREGSSRARAAEGQARAASTSARLPVARSRTKPRTASVRGMKGEAVMRAIDWRTLSARSVKAPGAQVGRAPV